MNSGFNPETTAQDIRSKSFLKSRGTSFKYTDNLRETTGSQFFKDNRIRSCSHVKETEGGHKAVPFYDKRNNTLYPTPSNVTQSWTSNVHSNKGTVYAGMGSLKPLHSVQNILCSIILTQPEADWQLQTSDLLTLTHLRSKWVKEVKGM
jgi:hypothetical protein